MGGGIGIDQPVQEGIDDTPFWPLATSVAALSFRHTSPTAARVLMVKEIRGFPDSHFLTTQSGWVVPDVQASSRCRLDCQILRSW